MIDVLYFASVRQTLGLEREQHQGAATIGALLSDLAGRGGAYAELFDPGEGLCFAVNQDFAERDDAIPDGAEVAIFPPVTGG